ncbi:MAG: subclass B3 metallo-beta-lactamase [Sphingomonadales bacterium BRH_c42]|nr:MAG: subclass B3 metallo-beta-lactamase [Sphingomonadales bacterium BRH_c42]
MSARIVFTAALVLASCTASSAQVPAPAEVVPVATEWASACEDWDEWDKPGPPFRIHGNTWYVGTCGIGAILITGDAGHILIDSGTEAGAEIVLQNIAKLGFDVRDVRYLLHSHEHFDHVGGMAKLKAATHAWLLSSTHAEPVLRSGIADGSDPQAAQLPKMEPIEVYQTISDTGTVVLGDIRLTAHETPGHTAGALSWQWRSCDKGECITIVYADSLSPVSSDGYRFSDHPQYVAAYREGIARVAALDCDILLTPHPSASGMRDKLLADGLASGMNCREYASAITARLDARLAQEAQTK